MHSSGTETFDTQGGENQQVARAKFLWKATDSLTATLSLDWTHTNQPSTASTVLATNTASPVSQRGAPRQSYFDIAQDNHVGAAGR